MSNSDSSLIDIESMPKDFIKKTAKVIIDSYMNPIYPIRNIDVIAFVNHCNNKIYILRETYLICDNHFDLIVDAILAQISNNIKDLKSFKELFMTQLYVRVFA